MIFLPVPRTANPRALILGLGHGLAFALPLWAVILKLFGII